MFILLFYQIVGATLLIGKGRNQINRVCGKKLNVTFLILVIKMYIFFYYSHVCRHFCKND